MTVSCPAPDGQIGIALRLSDFLGCEARALGENGFQALAGGPLVAGLLSGLVTIFVALIGYRFILGMMPTLRDGIGWAVRLGMVLTLATGWPAFQTLVYRVATDTPDELAAALLPAAGLPTEGIDVRVQQAYDAMRLGSSGVAPKQSEVQPGVGGPNTQVLGAPQGGNIMAPTLSYGRPTFPQTAMFFVTMTSGVIGALKLAIGFLLAIGPIPIMALLFDATLGLFVGWLRALTGAALATLAGIIVTALNLVMVEGELAHLDAIERGVSIVDPQALTTIVLAFGVVVLASIWAAFRMAGGLHVTFVQDRLPWIATARSAGSASAASTLPTTSRDVQTNRAIPPDSRRARGVAAALADSVHREQRSIDANVDITSTQRMLSERMTIARKDGQANTSGLGSVERRSSVRRTRSAARRDGIS